MGYTSQKNCEKLSFEDFRVTKTKFLCRTKQSGALGAILAQATRAPENESVFCVPSLVTPRGPQCFLRRV